MTIISILLVVAGTLFIAAILTVSLDAIANCCFRCVEGIQGVKARQSAE